MALGGDGRRGVLAGRSPGLRARSPPPPGRGRPGRAPRAGGAGPRRAGCGPAGWPALPIALGRRLPARHPGRRLRGLVPAVGRARQPDRARAGRRATTARRWPTSPAGMYDYHNNLRATHAASSPWWAWPANLKPVWFYQDSFAGPHGRRDLRRRQPGHLVALDPGLRLRRLAGLPAPQPRPGAGRDHVRLRSGCPGPGSTGRPSSTTTTRRCRSCSSPWPTSWPSSGTGRRAGRGSWPAAAGRGRRPGAGRPVAPPRPAVRRSIDVEKANPGSQACSGAASLSVSLSGPAGRRPRRARHRRRPRWSGSCWRSIAAAADGGDAETRPGARLARLAITAAVGVRRPGRRLARSSRRRRWSVYPSVPGEVLALGLLVVLAPLAYLVWTATSPRRFAVGVVLVAAFVFVLFYPNISGLPLPTASSTGTRACCRPGSTRSSSRSTPIRPVTVSLPGRGRSSSSRRSWPGRHRRRPTARGSGALAARAERGRRRGRRGQPTGLRPG